MLAFVVKLAFDAVVLLIIVGIVLTMISQATRARWTRHFALRTVMAMAYYLCAPARQLMKAVGLPTTPLDFSPVVTILGLRAVAWLALGVLRFFP